VHELDHLRRGERHRAAVAAADGLVCISQPVFADLERLVGIERPTLVLPTGTRVPSELPSATHDIDVLFAGKLGERQGVRLAVAAMRFLPSSRLVVLGGSAGDVEAVRDYAERLGVAGQVVFEGFVSPAMLPGYLARARVGVCPYPTVPPDADAGTELAWNGSSMKLLELMAYGVPAVASDIDAIRDVATHDRDAWLVEPDSPEALAEGIRRLLDDRELAGRLAAAGRQTATEFSWPRRAERLLEFLASL
jgi:glycosyltransferase involved in cell wall biosynthesis